MFGSSKKRNHKHRRSARNSGMGMGKVAAIIALPVTVIGGGALGLHYMDGEHIGDDFCFDRPDQTQVAILIDNSMEGLSAPQARDYETGLARSFDLAPANARISFFTTALDGQGSLARPIFTVCKPAATPAEREAIGAPSKPAPYLKRQAEEARTRYAEAVADVIAASRDAARRAKDSPILELVQAVSKYPGFQGRNRALTLVSDGIQNSETARFCAEKGEMPSYGRFKTRPAYRTIKPKPMTGVDVTLLLVEQFKLPNNVYPYCSNNEMRTWWPEFFKGNGAASVDLNRLRLGAGS